MSQPKRVLVADRSTLTHVALQQMLDPVQFILLPLAVVTFDEVSKGCRHFQPDIAVIKISAYLGVSVAQIVQFRQEFPHVKIVLVDEEDSHLHLPEMIRAGIVGYIVCNEAADMWQCCFQAVAGTGSYFYETALSRWRYDTKGVMNQAKTDDLTERDINMIRLLLAEYNNKEIADQLHLSQHTVNNNLCSLYRKLGVKGRAGAIVWAAQVAIGEESDGVRG